VVKTRGIIEDVEKRGLKEGHDYAVVTIDGQQYEVWDSGIYEQLLEGAEIEYQFRKTPDGRLLITDIGDSGETVQEGPEIGAECNDVPEHLASAYLALKAAIETVGDTVKDYSERVEKILATARKCRAYFEEQEYGSGVYG
jgi:hypothetical protein